MNNLLNLNRAKLFAIAEQVTGKDRNYFAQKFGVSYQMIDYILKEQRKSKGSKIERTIDRHIKKSLCSLKIYLDAA